MTDAPEGGMVGSAPNLRHRWLLLVPLIWQLGMTPAINTISWTPLGVPFLMLWEMAGIFVCVAVLRGVFLLDRRSGLEVEETAFARSTAKSAASIKGV